MNVNAAVASAPTPGADGLAASLAELAKNLGAVTENVRRNGERFAELRQAAELMTQSNGEIGEAARVAHQIAQAVLDQTRESLEAMEQTSAGINTLVDSVGRMEERLAKLEESLGRVTGVSENISRIAQQTRMLALNATIEAARAGEAGQGFRVVANEVKALAQQTGDATSTIGETVATLSRILGDLAKDRTASLESAHAVRGSTENLAETLDDLHTQFELVEDHISTIARDSEGNLGQCSRVTEAVAELTAEVEGDGERLALAAERISQLLDP